MLTVKVPGTAIEIDGHGFSANDWLYFGYVAGGFWVWRLRIGLAFSRVTNESESALSEGTKVGRVWPLVFSWTPRDDA